MNLPDAVLSASKLAVITGARGGLGAALAADLDSKGWATLRIDIAPEHVARGEASSTNGDGETFAQPTVYVQADVSDHDTMARIGELVAAPREAFLGVAGAGIISVGKTEHLSREDWDRTIRVNLTGTFVTLKSFIAAARAASTGRLIAIASDAGKSGEALLSHYSASKFGVIGFVQSLANELVSEGITVNAVCPSIVDTPMMQQLAEQMVEITGEGNAQMWRSRFVDEVPAGRACSPQDVAYVVRMLAEPESEFITGQSINVSGGKVKH